MGIEQCCWHGVLRRPACAVALFASLAAPALQAAPGTVPADTSVPMSPEWAVDADDVEPDLSTVEDEAGLSATLPSPGETSATLGGAAFMPFDLSAGTGPDPEPSRDEASLFQSAVMMLAAIAGIGWILRLWWRTQ